MLGYKITRAGWTFRVEYDGRTYRTRHPGVIQDIRVYPRAFTAEEVRKNYEDWKDRIRWDPIVNVDADVQVIVRRGEPVEVREPVVPELMGLVGAAIDALKKAQEPEAIKLN